MRRQMVTTMYNKWLYFYQIKGCLQISSRSTMLENAKTGEIIFSVTQNRTCDLPQFLRDSDDYAIIM